MTEHSVWGETGLLSGSVCSHELERLFSATGRQEPLFSACFKETLPICFKIGGLLGQMCKILAFYPDCYSSVTALFSLDLHRMIACSQLLATTPFKLTGFVFKSVNKVDLGVKTKWGL